VPFPAARAALAPGHGARAHSRRSQADPDSAAHAKRVHEGDTGGAAVRMPRAVRRFSRRPHV